VTAREGSIHAVEKVRVLQRKLYRVAKAQPRRAFGVLYDKVCLMEVLETAWEQVRRNRGSAGVDGETIADLEAYGVGRFLGELQGDLRHQRYRPEPVRRVYIPKADGRRRPLGIPRVRDRVVQAAVRLVIEPLFEASFRPDSYGFRPKRGARQAIEAIRGEVNRGRSEVIDLDLKSYFDTIDHDLLMKLVRRRVRDPRVLRLIRRWLRVGVLLDGVREESFVGTPQGGVISPLLANIYLHPLDVHWEREMRATRMIRYADDAVVLCPKGHAEGAMLELRRFLGRLRLSLNEEKTCVTTARTGFDFLGVHVRQRPSRRNPGRLWCYAWPSRRSMGRIRAKVRAATHRRDSCPSLAEKVRQLNPLLRGWGNYFRRTNAGEHFIKVDHYVWYRLGRWLSRKHHGGWRFASSTTALYRRAGLYTLCGTVRYAR
jgi:group II intron reverse transcriptase/maturase